MSQRAEPPPVPRPKRHSRQRFYLVALLALVALLGALVLYPVSTGALRAGELLCLFGLWGVMLLLVWGRRVARYALLGVTLCALAFLASPGGTGDAAALRGGYVDSLSEYGGTKYVWGGEGRFGIDCSGLVRRGLIDADFRRGLVTANPKLIRDAASLWWHDSSAKTLLAGYGGRTREILAAPSINELDHSRLLPGDIAVTADGLHTLAYSGDRTWIEADPIPMRVVKVSVPSGVTWFKVPVHVMRWRQFED